MKLAPGSRQNNRVTALEEQRVNISAVALENKNKNKEIFKYKMTFFAIK